MFLPSHWYDSIISLGAANNGRRLVLYGGTVTLRLHNRSRKRQKESVERRAESMDVVALVISILGFAATMFAIGYQFGKDSNNTQK